MIYIYNCYGGTHSSALAAAIHLKKIPLDQIPSKQEILNIPLFDQLTYSDRGKLYYHGLDSDGNEVYTIARGTCKFLVASLVDFYSILLRKYNEAVPIVFSNTSPTVPLAMTLGGFFSRACKIDSIGVPLLVVGAKQSFEVVKQLVDHTKYVASSTKDQITILENKQYQIPLF